tara:strand:- start:4389 stop:5021 length:633 start_codon:yes stop_codon:yes gene_type:complete
MSQNITPDTYGNEPKVLDTFVNYLKTVAVSKKTGKTLGEGSIKTYKSNAGSFLKSYGNIQLKFLMAHEYMESALEYDHKQNEINKKLKKSNHGVFHLQDMYRKYNPKMEYETQDEYYERIFKHKKFDLSTQNYIEIGESNKIAVNQWVLEYISTKTMLTEDRKKELFEVIIEAVNFVDQQKTRALYSQWNLTFYTSKKRKLFEIQNETSD